MGDKKISNQSYKTFLVGPGRNRGNTTRAQQNNLQLVTHVHGSDLTQSPALQFDWYSQEKHIRTGRSTTGTLLSSQIRGRGLHWACLIDVRVLRSGSTMIIGGTSGLKVLEWNPHTWCQTTLSWCREPRVCPAQPHSPKRWRHGSHGKPLMFWPESNREPLGHYWYIKWG